MIDVEERGDDIQLWKTELLVTKGKDWKSERDFVQIERKIETESGREREREKEHWAAKSKKLHPLLKIYGLQSFPE